MKTLLHLSNRLASLINPLLARFHPAISHPEPAPPARLSRSALLKLAFIVNSLADSPSEPDLPLPAVHAAAQEGRLLDLLGQYAGRNPSFAFLQSPPGTLDELNSALRDSSTILYGREFLKAGVYRNGYCLALALVLYALRERFPQIWPQPEQI